ncbi:membrane metallo-endopeptidase-like 1 [Ornithodoros turicata]|uniref:membrane metallo-endopeptidase-like 1 n=1 Tax=Ornithodoros turicata TaxID=34597 RepID=UPI00313A4A86
MGSFAFIAYPFLPSRLDALPFSVGQEIPDEVQDSDVIASSLTPTSGQGCRTQACSREARSVLNSLNSSFDPCDDFYLYVCSNWRNLHKPYSEEAKTSVDDDLLFQYSDLVGNILHNAQSAMSTAKLVFDTCVHPHQTLFGAMRDNLLYLMRVQNWPYLRTHLLKMSQEDVSARIGALYRYLGLDSLFHFSVLEGTSNSVPVIGEPDLLIGNFQGPLKSFEFLTTAFTSVMKWMDKFADTDVALFEVELARRKAPASHLNECVLKRCKRQVATDLPDNKLIVWKTILERAFDEHVTVKSNGEVRVSSPDYLLSFNDTPTPPRKSDILNYIVFRVVMALSPLIHDGTLRRDLASLGYAAHPPFAPYQPDVHYCIRFLDRFEPYVPMLLAYDESLHLVGYDTLQGLLLNDLRNAFHEFLSSESTFSRTFKNSLLERLAKISWEPLVPQALFSKEFRKKYVDKMYTGSPVRPLNDFYFSWLQEAVRKKHGTRTGRLPITGWKRGFLRAFPSLEPPFRQMEIPLPVFDFRLPNDESVRRLHVPRVATRVYRTLYQFVYTWAYNFYFKTGDTDPVSTLENARGCLRLDYAVLTSPFSKLTLNSDATSLMDLFDYLAIRPAFVAFMQLSLNESFWMKEAPLFSTEKLFFIYYALGYCEYNNPMYLDKYMTQSDESPAWYKVNGPLRHFEGFAKAFDCAKGTFMNPVHKCL